MAKKKPKKRKKNLNKKKSHRHVRSVPSLPEWYRNQLRNWSTKDILKELGELGLEMDEEIYRHEADEFAGPNEIAEHWIQGISKAPGRWADYLHFAGRELWRRFLPERPTIEFVVQELTEYMCDETGYQDFEDPEMDIHELMDLLGRLDACIEEIQDRDGRDREEIIDGIYKEYNFDLRYWLITVPMDLESAGYVDAAVDICRRYAFLDPGNMLGDRGQILASAGRHQEALEQVKENLQDLADDPWVLIKAGDVYRDCGDPDKALELFNRAMDMTDDVYTKDGARERLIPLYHRLGKPEEAEALEQKISPENAEDDILPFPKPLPSPTKKIGRNDPCPCGSGKKYKKCCMNKGV